MENKLYICTATGACKQTIDSCVHMVPHKPGTYMYRDQLCYETLGCAAFDDPSCTCMPYEATVIIADRLLNGS